MTIREMITQEYDIDVCDDVYDELFHAFVGPVALTEFGEEQFSDILDLPVTITEDIKVAVVRIDKYTDYEILHRRLRTFFKILAGYCDDRLYKQIVKEWFDVI